MRPGSASLSFSFPQQKLCFRQLQSTQSMLRAEHISEKAMTCKLTQRQEQVFSLNFIPARRRHPHHHRLPRSGLPRVPCLRLRPRQSPAWLARSPRQNALVHFEYQIELSTARRDHRETCEPSYRSWPDPRPKEESRCRQTSAER